MKEKEFAENEIDSYVAPQVEILVVEVEKGFAASGGDNKDEWGPNKGSGGPF